MAECVCVWVCVWVWVCEGLTLVKLLPVSVSVCAPCPRCCWRRLLTGGCDTISSTDQRFAARPRRALMTSVVFSTCDVTGITGTGTGTGRGAGDGDGAVAVAGIAMLAVDGGS